MPQEPNEFELNMIRNDPVRLKEIRSRLSDISWWMRLLSQKIGKRANQDDKEVGKFWQAHYRAVRLLDETAILACVAYVDLNPIRAAMAETIETSEYTSAQQRAIALQTEANAQATSDRNAGMVSKPIMQSLCPLTIDELKDDIGACCDTGVWGRSCERQRILAHECCELSRVIGLDRTRVASGQTWCDAKERSTNLRATGY